MGNYVVCFVLWFCFNLSVLQGQQYSSNIDAQLARPLGVMRKFMANLSESHINTIYRIIKKMGKIQPNVPLSRPFFCDAKNGPGSRSSQSPESVDKVRPGDIDIIAAIGDSLTAANGAISTELYGLFNENRGISFSIGGRGDWRKYLTIPNILREFNNDLYGYSTEDCSTTDRASKFNVAEATTRFDDMLYQTKILVKRMQRDPKVNMTSHWKLITIFLGNNDICSKFCELKTPEVVIKEHRKYVYETLRFLRENVPKVIINWVLIPNLVKLIKFRNIPFQCYVAERVECSCIYSAQSTPETLKRYGNIVLQMQKDQREIIYKDEFHTNTFTVNVQPFAQEFSIPELPNNRGTDLRYFASDCFHFSQLGQAAAASALWNNMMETEGTKQVDWMPAFQRFKCPTNEHPYIATRKNS